MTVILVEGFEHNTSPTVGTGYNTNDTRVPLVNAVSVTGGSFAMNTSTLPGSWSAVALQINDATTGGSPSFSWTNTAGDLIGQNRIVGSFRFRFTSSLPTTLYEMFVIGVPVGSAPRLVFNNSDSKLYAAFDGGLAGTEEVAVSAALSADTWYYVDFDWDATADPNTFKAKVDGANENTSSLAQAATTDSNVRIGCTISTHRTDGTILYDDLVLTNTGTDYPIGPMKVYGLAPSSNGTHATSGSFAQVGGTAGNWWEAVDSWGSGGGTFSNAEYIEQNVNGATDYIELGFESLPSLGSDTVFGASMAFTIWASTTGANTAKVWSYDGTTATEVFSGDCSDTAERYQRWYAIAPPGGSWSEAEANALKIRLGGATLIPGNPRFGAAILQVAVKAASGPTTYERQATVDATAAVVAADQKDALRQAASSAASAAVIDGFAIAARAAAASAATGAAVVGRELLSRSVAASAASSAVAAQRRDVLRAAAASAAGNAVVAQIRAVVRQVASSAAAASVVDGFAIAARQVAASATANVVVSGVVIAGSQTYERSAALDATADIASAQVRAVQRSAAASAAASAVVLAIEIIPRAAVSTATATATVAGQKDALRQVAASVAAATVVNGIKGGQVEAAAAFSATATVALAGQKVALRQVASAAAGAATVAGQRVLIRQAASSAIAAAAAGYQRALQRQAATDATGTIAVLAVEVLPRGVEATASASASVSGVVISGAQTYERSAALSASATVAAAQQLQAHRQVAASAASAAQVAGEAQGLTQRQVALDAIGAVTATGRVQAARAAAASAVSTAQVSGARVASAAVAASASGAIAASSQRDLFRTTTLDATAAVAIAHQRDLFRLAALGGTAAVTVVHQAELSRSAVLDAAAAVTWTGYFIGDAAEPVDGPRVTVLGPNDVLIGSSAGGSSVGILSAPNTARGN